jgi:hypothetical protein
MIYIIRAGDSMLVKIGFTKSGNALKRRLQGLRTGCPLSLRIEAKMNGSKLKEKCIHSFCISRHESGEWFRLNKEEVQRMVAKYKDWSPTKNGIERMSQLSHQVKKQYFK